MPDYDKLIDGPWEKLFEGTFQAYPIEIRKNNAGILLVIILEKQGEQVAGAIVEAFCMLSAKGDVQSFVSTLPRELVFFGKHDEKETVSFLGIRSTPSYAPYDEEKFYALTDELITKVRNSAALLTDVAKAYDVKVKKLGESSPEVQEAFFSQPLLVPLFTTAGHGVTQSAMNASPAGRAAVASAGQVLIGFAKDTKSPIEETLSDLQKTAVMEGTEIDRRRVLHVLVEGVLLSNAAAVVFDTHNAFASLAIPNQTAKKGTATSEEEAMAIDPIGFPVKAFRAEDDVQVNLKTIPAEGLLEIFGAGEQAHVPKIVEVAKRENIESIQNWVEAVQKESVSDTFTGYFQAKGVRTLRLIQARYPKLFDGPNNVNEISKNWVRAIGRLGQIDARELDARAQLLLVTSLVGELKAYYQEKGTSKAIKSVIIIPDFPQIIGRTNDVKSKIADQLVNDLLQLSEFGVGFIVSTPKEIDLPEALAAAIDAKIGIVSKTDVGIRLPKQNPYRATIRPTLSQFLE